MTALLVGVTVAVALLAVLVAGLLRANAEVIRALHQMGVELGPDTPGSRPTAVALTSHAATPRPTPGRPDAGNVIDLVGVSPQGDALSLAVSEVRHDTLVGFLTSGCQTCRGFWEAFRTGPPDVPGGARLVVVTRGPEAESPGTIAGLAGSGGAVPVVMSSEAWEHYDIPYAPYFVFISGVAGRVVGEGVAAGWEEVRTLVANAVADGTTGPGAGSAVAADPGAMPAAAAAAAAAAMPSTAAAVDPALRPRSRADQIRDDSVDLALLEAGIRPGDPRLHPTSIDGGATRR